MNKLINKIIIVGGGTAGCISALILKKRFPDKEVIIIESADVGIVGVGESSTEHWVEFCRFIGIHPLEVILHCNATFKIGVYFQDWADNDFMHSIESPYSSLYGSSYKVYTHQISLGKEKSSLQYPGSWKNKIPLSYLNQNNILNFPIKQYHFDTFELNKFLHKLCSKNNIKFCIDNLIEVKLDSDTGDITSVLSENQEYSADFFIDCSGFSRFLLNKTYGIKWKSYDDYLPVNSAIAFPTEEMEEYNKYTKSTARNAGWSWTIPTQTRTGNGYVYCDKFITKEEAHKEMEQQYQKPLDIAKEFKFNPGRLEKAWHKNCYAIGLAQSFVEPLESTSIGSVIQQMFCFMHFLPSYDSNSCNQHINNIFDNIVDYVQAHYLVKREDTPFWKEVKYNLKLTPNLEMYLEKWKNRMPLETDILCSWGMFYAVNYIPILYGLDWFDTDKIRDEYDYDDENIKTNVKRNLDSINNFENETTWVGHKEFIKLVKENIQTSLLDF